MKKEESIESEKAPTRSLEYLTFVAHFQMVGLSG